ncbi:DUF6086 family protein [Streptomyces sp. NBC_00503]|uniref:DUF6086 family protein n=1 Tax=Streptomyces sp. NBC_00503 TaxID=2903659 RepID=UPI002E807A00|nr:DUF6086 family protein [Streptomyces sp. NBC_00503]WUD81932.1 DUF6086 family protein [Streptomyces sp. NBC_00503]
MSQIYQVGEESLWNPSNGAARLFHRQLAVFEAELGLPSGIGPLENDECRIDPAALGPFTEALLARHGHTGHAVVRALSEGFVATVLVLAERAGAQVRRPVPSDSPEGRRDVQVPLPGPYGSSYEDRLRAAARELSRAMPR